MSFKNLPHEERVRRIKEPSTDGGKILPYTRKGDRSCACCYPEDFEPSPPNSKHPKRAPNWTSDKVRKLFSRDGAK